LKDFNGEHRKVISVGRRIKDISITGFTVNGFSGLNIAIVGARDACVSKNTVSSSAQYGILTVGSKNSNIKHNKVLSTQGTFPFYFIGICMDDVSSVTIANNDISGYFIGLCVQTAGADIYGNKVHDTCVGAFIDPGIKGAKLYNNKFSNTLPGCPAMPKLSSGITISGAMNTVVKRNRFSGIKNSGQAAAVVIVDDDTGAVASGNRVEKNVFRNNDLDIFEQTTGKGNVVKKNHCKLSTPANLCK
jgi:parallel beta-helix repeat protein